MVISCMVELSRKKTEKGRKKTIFHQNFHSILHIPHQPDSISYVHLDENKSNTAKRVTYHLKIQNSSLSLVVRLPQCNIMLVNRTDANSKGKLHIPHPICPPSAVHL